MGMEHLPSIYLIQEILNVFCAQQPLMDVKLVILKLKNVLLVLMGSLKILVELVIHVARNVPIVLKGQNVNHVPPANFWVNSLLVKFALILLPIVVFVSPKMNVRPVLKIIYWT